MMGSKMNKGMVDAIQEAKATPQDELLPLPSWLEGVELNPEMGEKGGFKKTTVTMPDELYQAMKMLSARMSIEADVNHSVSSLFRIAAVEMFRRGDWEMPRNWKPFKRK